MTLQSSNIGPMSPKQLRQLKVGDQIYIGNKYVTVENVGTKFITTSSLGDKISIVSAMTHHPAYSQRCENVYASKEIKEAYATYCSSVDEARRYISNSISRLRSKELLVVKEFIENLRKEKGA